MPCLPIQLGFEGCSTRDYWSLSSSSLTVCVCVCGGGGLEVDINELNDASIELD